MLFMSDQPLRLSFPSSRPVIKAEVDLPGSKSISNRALLILQLAGVSPRNWLSGLSSARDTVTLRDLLEHGGDIFNAGDAGTTFRFLTAYLALGDQQTILTGSARMRERPVGALVDALRALGADIEYLEKEGYPPLGIHPSPGLGRTTKSIRVPAGVSSQFLSALLMIGPRLPEGLELIPEGKLVSRPYLDMTLRMMRYFGARADWQDDRLIVAPGQYEARPLSVESDWSAASYWYALAALSAEADILLKGLQPDSWQGDSVLAEMMTAFDVQTTFEAGGARLRRGGKAIKTHFEWDFTECPDLAQTLAVVCAALGVRGLFSGLETLSIKETDRVSALKNELSKVGTSFSRLPDRFSAKRPDSTFYLLEGAAHWDNPPVFATYGDHRMAMAFAPLALRSAVDIENPAVVGKSYPDFWSHLVDAGFETESRDLQPGASH